jgi:hypothetical protein
MPGQTRSCGFDDMRKLVGVDVEDDKPSSSHLVVAEQIGSAAGHLAATPRRGRHRSPGTPSHARQAGQL